MGRERSRVKGKIAIEEHFLPPGRTDLLSSPGWSPEAMVQIARALTDTEDRLALMDEGGVEMAVLSLASDGIQNILDPGAASET
jgi:hypothetical protein